MYFCAHVKVYINRNSIHKRMRSIATYSTKIVSTLLTVSTLRGIIQQSCMLFAREKTDILQNFVGTLCYM